MIIIPMMPDGGCSIVEWLGRMVEAGPLPLLEEVYIYHGDILI
jgi:hypothetical protein